MRIEQHGGVVRVSDLRQLDALQADLLRREVAAVLPVFPQSVEFELAGVDNVDCAGLGALLAIQQEVRQRNPAAGIRLVRPAAPVRLLLRLTRMQQLFTVT